MRFHRPVARPQTDRRGTYLVEFSVVIPVFTVFMLGIMEFGHAYMVINTITAAAKTGARLGGVDGVTTLQVRDRVQRITDAAFPAARSTVYVKDASVFDTGTVPSNLNYAALPDIELDTAESLQLFLVRVEVPYNDVSLLPPLWVRNITLVGQSVMRHE